MTKDYRQQYAEHIFETRGEFIENVGCEFRNCNSFKQRDIHHIVPRGTTGSDKVNEPRNLLIVCRECHNKIEGNQKIKEELIEKYNLQDLL